MKKYILFSLITAGIFFFSCSKNNTLPPYTPPTAVNFSVGSLKHTRDTVNVGDTIYLTATGTVYDSSSLYHIYTYLNAASTVSGASTTYNYGSATSPITINRTIGAQNAAGLFTWTSTIPLIGATLVPPKTKLTISGTFIYQLSLSSEGGGTATATDAGQANKTVYVQ